MKVLFAQCRAFVLPPLNNMEVLTHILDGWTKDVTIATTNILMEGKFVSMFQMEGSWIFTPPTNNNIQTFR